MTVVAVLRPEPEGVAVDLVRDAVQACPTQALRLAG